MEPHAPGGGGEEEKEGSPLSRVRATSQPHLPQDSGSSTWRARSTGCHASVGGARPQPQPQVQAPADDLADDDGQWGPGLPHRQLDAWLARHEAALSDVTARLERLLVGAGARDASRVRNISVNRDTGSSLCPGATSMTGPRASVAPQSWQQQAIASELRGPPATAGAQRPSGAIRQSAALPSGARDSCAAAAVAPEQRRSPSSDSGRATNFAARVSEVFIARSSASTANSADSDKPKPLQSGKSFLTNFSAPMTSYVSGEEEDHGEVKTRTVCQRLRGVLSGNTFQVIIGALIVVSLLIQGVDIEVHARTGSVSPVISAIQNVFNVVFVVEVSLKISAFQVHFFCKPMRNSVDCLNVLDFLIAISCLVDLLFNVGSELSMIRIIRLVRLVRVVRLVRFARQVREFRKMIYALAASVQTLVWAVLLLLSIMYMFAIVFSLSSLDVLQRPGLDAELRFKLEDCYGSLTRTIYTLWVAISSGESWKVVCDPLWQVSWGLGAVFVAYVGIVFLGVLNIVTSVFVESAMTSTQHFRDLLCQEKAHARETCAQHLKEIFNTIDKDGSGEVCVTELERFLSDPLMDLKEYFHALELDVQDARSLFVLLDHNESGEISIDEFVDGCTKLKGEAKSFDINCLMYNCRRMMMRLQSMADQLGELSHHSGKMTRMMMATQVANGGPGGPSGKDIENPRDSGAFAP